MVNTLLEWTNICPDLPDHYGRMALSWAAENGHQKVVELLLTRTDANADYLANEGKSPLHWALKSNHECVAMVLQEWASRGQ